MPCDSLAVFRHAESGAIIAMARASVSLSEKLRRLLTQDALAACGGTGLKATNERGRSHVQNFLLIF